jgi:fatty-acyl-CoA synthase
VAALAHQLRTRYRVGRGDRVSVLAENDPRMFELQFALWRLGAIFAPLNWRLAPAELRILCADCRPALLVHDRAWAVLGAELADHATGGARLAWGPVPGVDDYEVLISEASDGVAAGNRAGFEDIAQILYTSGTTGRPKGALISHGSIHWQAINLAHSSGVAEPGCHQYDPMPLFHAGGLNVLANPVLYWGGRVSAVARLVPSAMVAAMGDPGQRITHFASFPAICHQMAAEPGFRTADFSALRYLVLAAGTVSPELLAAWRSVGVRLQPQYGGTEMGPMALVLGRDELAAADRGSVGRPPMHTEVRLVDEHGVDVPDGTVGEIWLRGGSITSGYWGRPRSDHFTDDWFRTGDAARREPDGLYYIAGRIKDMYKSGGENVYPAEVEIALRDAPGVAEIVVVGVPDPRWDEVGLAAVVPVPGAEVTLAGLRDYGTERIARYKLPAHLVLLAEFPRNATGKVSRVELRDQFVRSSD